MGVLAVAGCKSTTKDLLEFLRSSGHSVALLITLSPDQGRRHEVAGYEDLAAFARAQGIPVHVAQDYGLNAEADRAVLGAVGLDVLLVMGWQRLIPAWLLAQLGVGAFGMHGSSERLPAGRGRSPLNWSIIQGRRSFLTCLFRYDSGIDSGAIVAMQPFEIHPFDTAASLHEKNTIAMCHLLQRHLPDLLAGRVAVTPQDDVPPSYYPKRRAVDGEIFWSDSTEEIHRLVNAVTRPFPGAATWGPGGERILVWRAIPFDSVLDFGSRAPGEIVFVSGPTFVVKTGDSTLLVQEWEGGLKPRAGMVLTHRQPYRWDWRKLPMPTAEYCSRYDDIPEAYRRT